ncbi:transposase [Oscillospiraceae bacterium PP1C4]
MSKNRRKYDEGFKKRVVRMSYSSERGVTSVTENLEVTSNMIYRWRKKYTPDTDKTQMSQQQDELNQLRGKITEFKEENYILKKLRPSSRKIGNNKN